MLNFPILTFWENILPELIPNFQLEIVPVIIMGNKHGETVPSQKRYVSERIFIQDWVRTGLTDNRPRNWTSAVAR